MSTTEHKISVASFSREPVGRYLTDGAQSGQAFRERVLLPALLAAELVTVDLDGTEGYGSSFLEEAFAGTMRCLNLSAEEFRRRVRIVGDEDPSLLVEIAGYLADEERRRSGTRRDA